MSQLTVFLRSHYDVFKDFAAPVATVIAAIAAADITFRFGQKQTEIAKAQLEIAKAQAAVADRTWRTANEKVVLELFEKRFAIYDKVRSVISEVNRDGAADNDLLYKFDEATDRVPFFFGQDVVDYIKTLRSSIIMLCEATTMLDNPEGPDRVKYAALRTKMFTEIIKFYTDAPPILVPYLHARQKVE